MAQEVMSTINSINDPNVDLIERAKVYVAYFPTRDQVMSQMRPWVGEFCPDADSFGPPKGPQHLWTRMQANFGRFKMNYGVIALLIASWSLITTSPFLVVCVALTCICTYLGWTYAEASIRSYMTQRAVKWGVILVLLIMASWLILCVATWLTVVAASLIILHSAFRDDKLLTTTVDVEAGELLGQDVDGTSGRRRDAGMK
jgi:hypothetical protein